MGVVNALMKDPEMTHEDLASVLDPQDMTALQSQVVGSSVKQQDLINASVAAGGPSSLNEAIDQAMTFCDISLEKLSKKTNISTYRLKQMIYGDMDMSPKTLGKIMKAFHQVRPDIYPAD